MTPHGASPGQSEDRATALLSVEHETSYGYSLPVEAAHHLAFLRPQSQGRQQLEAFSLTIDPAPADPRTERDVFGNWRTSFSLFSAHQTLTVRSHGRVRLQAREMVASQDSAPWEVVRDTLRYRVGAPFDPAVEFCMPSRYVPRLAQMVEFGAPVFTPGRPVAEVAIALMRRIHREFRYQGASTDVDTPVAEVLRTRRGVCQDFAHLMIGVLRMFGLPARYVSGYLLTAPPPGARRSLVGADASHAWVSVYCPGLPGDWLELDPTNDLLPDLAHVPVAYGRDYADVTPLRGVIRGGGHHVLSVRVHTTLLGSDPSP